MKKRGDYEATWSTSYLHSSLSAKEELSQVLDKLKELAKHVDINGNGEGCVYPGKEMKGDGNQLPTTPTIRNFSIGQLRKFNGIKLPNSEEPTPVYLSINGTVFDVSAGAGFYGPGGPYEVFAGRECGAALATMSMDENLLDDYITNVGNLDEEGKKAIDGWIQRFTEKYKVVGRLITEGLPASLPPPTTTSTTPTSKGGWNLLPSAEKLNYRTIEHHSVSRRGR